MKKLFGFFAIALAFVACSQLEETQIQPDENEGIVINAQLAPKTVITKAVADGGSTITASWAKDEHIAILYEAGGLKKMADAIVKSVDGSGAAQISFTVDAATTDGTACTIVYPLSAAKDDYTGVKDAATLLGTQNGMLNNPYLDVRVGEGKIGISTPGLTVTIQPVPQFAIFKFSAESSLTGVAINKVKSFTVTTGGQAYTITPATPQQSVYAALPPVTNAEVTFTAVGKLYGSDVEKTFNRIRRSVTFAADKLYTSTIKMISATLNETLDSFDTKMSGVNYFGANVTCIGSSVADGVGLQISQGNNIYISTQSGQIITRVEFHSSDGSSEASKTSSTRGSVNWKNGAENGSIEGINATFFSITNSSGSSVKIDHFVVYYITQAPTKETISTSTNGVTSYASDHFSVTGTKGDNSGLRIDAQGGQNSITIWSKDGEAISKVVLNCTYGKDVAENTSSTKGIVNWTNGNDQGYIVGINSTNLEITNSTTSKFVQISSVDVYYFIE